MKHVAALGLALALVGCAITTGTGPTGGALGGTTQVNAVNGVATFSNLTLSPASGAIMLIDWDTVGLAPPERDLWMVATETGAELRRYTELTGRPVDMAAIELYRLRWALDDLSCFVRDLRAPHRRTPGTEHAWQALEITIAEITR